MLNKSAEKSYIEKERERLEKAERKFASARIKSKPSIINEKLDRYLPEKLQSTLYIAFNKAFKLIFEKGTAIISKTYNVEKYDLDYKLNSYALELKQNRKNIKAFSKKANKARNINMFISGTAGISMGIIGIGIPDIPIITAMILRSVYEIALSYGFDYKSSRERIFILKIIETSMKTGIDFARSNSEINKQIDTKNEFDISEEEQISNTSTVLAEAMLYMKFLQGIPVVGAVGGAFDFAYINRIAEYAALKYKRRFLNQQ